MKAYRLTVTVVDHDGVGGEGITRAIEGARYPNHCISPTVLRVDEADIGRWHDGHPLNHADKAGPEAARLFGDAHADAAQQLAVLELAIHGLFKTRADLAECCDSGIWIETMADALDRLQKAVSTRSHKHGGKAA